ncbi:hypothetical protein FF38_14192 [Lucilia cuprina]|uniref:Uncharacterized protein n=1 Tax=Lucilia cuprina TaxID=7375 RepID=A0A0L0BWN3_LUCCU|nr:hypothetical protein FF38_14192 [Lucilia cuprina]
MISEYKKTEVEMGGWILQFNINVRIQSNILKRTLINKCFPPAYTNNTLILSTLERVWHKTFIIKSLSLTLSSRWCSLENQNILLTFTTPGHLQVITFLLFRIVFVCPLPCRWSLFKVLDVFDDCLAVIWFCCVLIYPLLFVVLLWSFGIMFQIYFPDCWSKN